MALGGERNKAKKSWRPYANLWRSLEYQVSTAWCQNSNNLLPTEFVHVATACVLCPVCGVYRRVRNLNHVLHRALKLRYVNALARKRARCAAADVLTVRDSAKQLVVGVIPHASLHDYSDDALLNTTGYLRFFPNSSHNMDSTKMW